MRRPLHDSTNYPVPGTISRRRRRTPAPRGTLRAKLGYVLFPLVWAAVLLGLHQAYADHYAITPGDVVVEGTVIGSDDGRQIGRPTRHFAVVDYTDPATGDAHRITGDLGSRAEPVPGETVTVAFSPDDPADGTILTGSRSFLTLLAIVAGLFGLIGAGRLVKLLGTELGRWRRTRRTT